MADCPICRSSMRLVIQDDIELDVCDSCQGVWLDPHEFEQLENLKNSLAETSSEPDAWKFKCPCCEGSRNDVVSTNFGSVIRCVACCGVFVPRQLLGSIAEQPKESTEELNWFKDVWGPIGYILTELSTLR